MLLALDTATAFASVALYDGRQVLGEVSWQTQRRHTAEVMSQIEALVRLVGMGPAALTAVAVAIGPGSYTGTRVGVSLAKGMVAAAGLPLVGVPTLDVVAYPHLGAWPVCALVAAGRGRYHAAVYAADIAWPRRLGDWQLGTLAELLARLTPPLRFAGELAPADAETLAQAWGDRAAIVPPALAVRRAGILAALAWRRLQAGERDDPITLSPIYLG
jgi:tRNA threonylcarbamoyladenosine biosynthesis protein TsaB